MSETSLLLDSRLSWAALAFVSISASVDTALLALYEVGRTRESGGLWSLLANSAWSWWVYVDRRQKSVAYPFEFDALVFFAWPAVVPYHLIRTRAKRRRLSGRLLWLLYALPILVAAICYLYLSFQ